MTVLHVKQWYDEVPKQVLQLLLQVKFVQFVELYTVVLLRLYLEYIFTPHGRLQYPLERIKLKLSLSLHLVQLLELVQVRQSREHRWHLLFPSESVAGYDRLEQVY